MEKQRIIYLDILKIFAIILVIFNHSHWCITSEGVIGSFLHNFLYGICKCAVPIFIMVTGALLLKKKTTYKEVFSKRIVRIIPAIIIVFLLTTLIYDYHFADFFKGLVFYGFVNAYWIWYLYLLIGLYLITPFLQKMIKNMQNKDFIILAIIFILVSGLIQSVPTLTNLFLGHELSVNDWFLSGFFTIEIGLYITGYYLNNLKISFKAFIISLIIFFINTIINTLLLWFAINKGFTYDNVLPYSSFLVTLMAICLFIIIKYLFSKPLKNKKIEKLIVISSLSVFGVYLFHPFVLDYFSQIKWMKDLLTYNSFIGVITLDLIVFIILTILVYFLRKIPYVKKFL